MKFKVQPIILSHPFRPLGHASDGSPAADALLLEQFGKYRATLTNQIIDAAEDGVSGASVADYFDDISQSAESAVAHALRGNKIMQRPEIKEISQPGFDKLSKEKGKVIDLNVNYLLMKGQKAFAGLGADIYGKTLDRLMDKSEKEGRRVYYVHQENHHVNKTDTRGGVYGELNQVSEKNLQKNFINFLPQEAQIAQVGAGIKAQDQNSIVFVKGPHTIFNEHAKDHIKYGAFRKVDCGEHANYIYLMDGGSLAMREKETIVEADSNQEVDRSVVLARVGEHHNTPVYQGYNGDANVLCACPLDVNLFEKMLPSMIDYHDTGRMLVTFMPTSAFGLLHPKAELVPTVPTAKGDWSIGQNDVLRAEISGKNAPKNGKELIVVSWGPDSKWIAKTLAEDLSLKSTLFVLNYMKAPNSLINYLAAKVAEKKEVEVLSVDPNPDTGFLAPVMNAIRQQLHYPDNLNFSECFVDTQYVPYGLGEGLLAPKDLIFSLSVRNIISPVTEDAARIRQQQEALAQAAPKKVAQSIWV